MIQWLKRLIWGDEGPRDMDFMPSTRRAMSNPRAKVQRRVTARGQVCIPAEVRRGVDTAWSPMEPGDWFSFDVFAPDYHFSDKYNTSEAYISGQLTESGHLTIPKAVRDDLGLHTGDTVALYVYVSDGPS